jgi:hypothetical protein
LFYLDKRGESSYNALLKEANSSGVIRGRTQFNAVVKLLNDHELIERNVLTSFRPARTMYRVTKRGKLVLSRLKDIEQEIS